MKYMQKAKIYKAANVTFNPETKQAYSYNWWRFVDVIGGLVVFNNYTYSNATAKHQGKVRRLLQDIGVAVHFEIEAPGGLQNIDSAIFYYEKEIASLQALVAKKGTRKAKNEERLQAIADMQKKIITIKALQKVGA